VNQSEKYRRKAAECYDMALAFSDHHKKAAMLAIAQSWKLLADQAERNSYFEAAIAKPAKHGNGPGLMPYFRQG
jgi:hypothetical protein